MLWQHIIHCRGRFYKEEFRETAGRLLSPLLAYFFRLQAGSPALAGEQGLTERHAILYSKGMNYSRKEEHLHMTLRELEAGKSAVIRRVGGEGALRQHFLDMGMIPGAEVTVVKLAPMGDPMEVQVHGYELTLRLAEADQIDIEPIRQRSRSHVGVDRARDPDHPGLGESGKYHSKEDEHPLPEDTVLTYALVGNQNCGKTTLFNQLTGARQHVGNFPGVTVDRKTGVIRG